jgi:hypothetical protein
MSTYSDKAKCPKGHTFSIQRREVTAGKKVKTYCRMCKCSYLIKAGPVKERAATAANKEK